jgi:beta-glucanase (GH16 family)
MWSRSITKSDKQLSAYCNSIENAYIKKGKLHLRVYKNDDHNMPYKAGRVIANNKYWFKKGKIEIRAKAPMSSGLWPAIWFSGANTLRGYHVELDLMEYINAMGDNAYTAVYHLWGNFRDKAKNHISYRQKVPINVGKWHVYSLEISDYTIIMKVDEMTIYEIQRGQFGEECPDDQEFSLRLAMAYGGYGAKKTGIDDSALPAEFLIDYVRFYKLREAK